VDLTKADIDTFLGYVAKARYVQELETDIVAKAISLLFSE